MAYFMNPIALFGGTILLLAGLFFVMQRLTRGPFKVVWLMSAQVVASVALAMILLGTAMGLGHQAGHAACLAKLNAGQETKGCADLFILYGP